MGDKQPATGKKYIDLEQRIYRLLGQYDGFYTHPPLDHRKKYFGTDLVCFNNDGHEVWLGTSDTWHVFYSHSVFRQICFWYLAQWIFIDWFGLRTFFWFKLLNRQCRKITPWNR